MLSNNEILLNFMFKLIKVDEAQGDGKIAITDLTLNIFSCLVLLYLLTKEEKKRKFLGDIADCAQGVYIFYTSITSTSVLAKWVGACRRFPHHSFQAHTFSHHSFQAHTFSHPTRRFCSRQLYNVTRNRNVH